MTTNFKWLRRPKTNETILVKAVQLWEVRWMSRCGKWHTDIKPAIEAFTSADDANAFAESLRNAFSLLHHTGEGTDVIITKAK